MLFQVILMVGLPGSGKTYWAKKHCAEHPERRYNILSTGALFERMKVSTHTDTHRRHTHTYIQIRLHNIDKRLTYKTRIGSHINFNRTQKIICIYNIHTYGHIQSHSQ